MQLIKFERSLPYPINDVFALTIDLERAPHWHKIFTSVKQLTPDPIGLGSRFQLNYGTGGFELEIAEFHPPNRLIYRGEPVNFGTIPYFTVELFPEAAGSRVIYTAHPEVRTWLQPIMKIVAAPWGRWDLNRYFNELESMLAGQPIR